MEHMVNSYMRAPIYPEVTDAGNRRRSALFACYRLFFGLGIVEYSYLDLISFFASRARAQPTAKRMAEVRNLCTPVSGKWVPGWPLGGAPE